MSGTMLIQFGDGLLVNLIGLSNDGRVGPSMYPVSITIQETDEPTQTVGCHVP
jgi:hypothetical protein